MKTFKTLSRKTILDEGKFLVVENHEVQTPAGQLIPNWPWVITPDYINVIAVTEDKKFLLFQQALEILQAGHHIFQCTRYS